MELIKANNPILLHPSLEFTEDEYQRIVEKTGYEWDQIQKMHEFMEQIPEALGLAAVQIGWSKCIFLARISNNKEILTFINPKLIEHSSTIIPSYEGCLSLPTISGFVIRPNTCTVLYQTLDGKEETSLYTGLDSSVVLHELDHLNGILFPERGFNRFQRRAIKKALKIDLRPKKEYKIDGA